MKKSFQHTIDFLFPIALFFVFTSTALLALLLAANIYNGIVTDSNRAFEQGTTLAYITQKIRQNDSGETGQIYLSEFDGYDALAISQNFSGALFTTYIYEVDGSLKEIFLQNGVEAGAEAGTTIMEIGDLQMEELSEGLFKFSCVSSDGTSDSVIIGVRSESP